jgi:hypothetical protein
VWCAVGTVCANGIIIPHPPLQPGPAAQPVVVKDVSLKVDIQDQVARTLVLDWGALALFVMAALPLPLRTVVAACAVLDLFERERVLEANRAKAQRFDAMAAPLANHPAVRDWRRLGMIWAFEVAGTAPDFARRAADLAMQHHALLRPIGDTVYFMPPYVAGDEEFAILVEAGLAIANALGKPS